jgi:hypothetical protein
LETLNWIKDFIQQLEDIQRRPEEGVTHIDAEQRLLRPKNTPTTTTDDDDTAIGPEHPA